MKTVTIIELDHRYCMWPECGREAHFAVYEEHECVGEFCKTHATAEKRKMERRSRELADLRIKLGIAEIDS